MVLNSTNVALITRGRLCDLNDEIERKAVMIRIETNPIDQDTDSVIVSESRVARVD